MSNSWNLVEHREGELTATKDNTKRLELDGLTMGYVFTDRMEFLSDILASAPLLPEMAEMLKKILDMVEHCGYGGSNTGIEKTHEKRIRALLVEYERRVI